MMGFLGYYVIEYIDLLKSGAIKNYNITFQNIEKCRKL